MFIGSSPEELTTWGDLSKRFAGFYTSVPAVSRRSRPESMALIWDCSSKLPLPRAKSDYVKLKSVGHSWFLPLSPPRLVLLYLTQKFSSLEHKELRITHCKTPWFCKGKHDPVEKKKVQTAQSIPEKWFFPCLLMTTNPTRFSFKPNQVKVASAIRKNAYSHPLYSCLVWTPRWGREVSVGTARC